MARNVGCYNRPVRAAYSRLADFVNFVLQVFRYVEVAIFVIRGTKIVKKDFVEWFMRIFKIGQLEEQSHT